MHGTKLVVRLACLEDGSHNLVLSTPVILSKPTHIMHLYAHKQSKPLPYFEKKDRTRLFLGGKKKNSKFLIIHSRFFNQERKEKLRTIIGW